MKLRLLLTDDGHYLWEILDDTGLPFPKTTVDGITYEDGKFIENVMYLKRSVIFDSLPKPLIITTETQPITTENQPTATEPQDDNSDRRNRRGR